MSVRDAASPPGRKRVRIIIYLILLLVILPCFWFIAKVILNPSEIPSLGGYYLLTVESGSMSPAIDTGDMIIMKQVEYRHPQEAVGKIIAFHSDEYIVTHRVTKAEEKDGQYLFYTRGDANNAEDKDPVKSGQIIGEYVVRLKGVGAFIWVLQSQEGIVGFIILPVLGWGLIELIFRKRRKC